MMNRTPPAASLRLAAALLAGLMLSSCSAPVELPDDALVRPPEEQEPAYLPTYSKTVVAGWPKGRALAPHDISRVRLPEQVHSYHLGRLPSHDRREMHEAHTVYRLEQDARWDNRLPATPMDSRGVVLGVIDPARKDIPDDTIIQQERQALAAKSVTMRKSMGELDVLRVELLKKKREFEQAEKDVTDIKAYLEKTLQEREALQAKLKLAEDRIVELVDKERLRIGSSNQGYVPKK
ncbi:MAG: hypothetical protein ACO1TE_12330 [Prosthecobacter sp.]